MQADEVIFISLYWFMALFHDSRRLAKPCFLMWEAMVEITAV
jgi:hypothetical protein